MEFLLIFLSLVVMVLKRLAAVHTEGSLKK